MPVPSAIDELQVLCQPHYNEPDDITMKLISSVSGLIDKSDRGSESTNLMFSHDIYPRTRGGLQTIAFDDEQHGFTQNSNIRNENQTWVFTSKVDILADNSHGILSYGNDYDAGTFMYRKGDASATGEIVFNGIVPRTTGFLGIRKGDRFPLWGRGGEGFGGAVMYRYNGSLKWIWKYYDLTDEYGNAIEDSYFKLVTQNGNLRVNDSGDYQGNWTLPYRQYHSGGWEAYVREQLLGGQLSGNMAQHPYVEITKSGNVARGGTQVAASTLSISGDDDFNIYTLEFDRELYLLNVYVNGVQTLTQAFNKDNLAERKRISVFTDLSRSLSAKGQFGELLVLPYIDQDARRSIEAYLSNKWSVPISNALTVAPNFTGPPAPRGRYDLTNFYPEVIEDKPTNDSVFVRNEGIVEDTPSGGIWLSPGGVGDLPKLPGRDGWTHDDGGVLWEHSASGTMLFWRRASRLDMVIREMGMVYYDASHGVYTSDRLSFRYNQVNLGHYNPQDDNAKRALTLSKLPIGEPEYQRYLPISWASDPYDTSTITHKISGFNDDRDGYYARVDDEQGVYLWFEHNALAYKQSVYPTYQLYDGEFLDTFKYYGLQATSNLWTFDFVEEGFAFFRYKKIANLDCGVPNQDVYIYCVVEGLDNQDPSALARKLVFSDRLGKRTGTDVVIAVDEMDLIMDGAAINLGSGSTVEAANAISCSSRAPVMPMVRIEDDQETVNYNTSIVDGDLLLTEVNNDHLRKTYNGNMCIISQKYQPGDDPKSLDVDGIRGFFNRLNDYVSYHRRELGDYQFEGRVRRLVSEPRPVLETKAGIQVSDPLDVDAFIISNDVSLVTAGLDYEYSVIQSIDMNNLTNYNGSVTISDSGLRMVTNYGHCYKRSGVFDAWEFVEKLTLGATSNSAYAGELGYFSRSGAKISGDGTHILLGNKGTSGPNSVDVRFWDENDNISSIEFITSPHPTNDFFSSYFGYGAAISKDGKYVCTGTRYTNGAEGAREQEGMFHIWEKNNSGRYVLAQTEPVKLRGQDFNVYGLGSTDFFDSCAFSENSGLMLSNDSIRAEPRVAPILALRDGVWKVVTQVVGSKWGYGRGVQLEGNTTGSFRDSNSTIAKFDHNLSGGDYIVVTSQVGPSSNFPLGRWRQSKDGRIAVQSGYNLYKSDGVTNNPRPIEIRVHNFIGAKGSRQTPLQEIKTIKNNWFYDSSRGGRVTRTGNYDFAGPMTLGAVFRFGNYSELYVFAENKLHIMQENVTSLRSTYS
jgi:hypothetical protein